jgi:hypothetical protein
MLPWAFLTVLGAAPAPLPDGDIPGTSVETVHIELGDLSVLLRDNSQSPAILSGIDALFNRKEAPDFDAFDPDTAGASAGLNFEHIIAGHENPNNAFAPRQGPYRLHRLRDGRSVVLARDRKDCPWDVSSTLRYTVVAPHAIGFEFRCVPHDATRFGSRRHAISFFANYMNDVAEVPIHFRGIDRAGGPEQWIAADAPPGHPDWNQGGTYRSRDAADLAYDDGVKFRLNSWSYDYPRFTRPFYYGRAAHGMVFMLMFDRMHSAEDEIRFSPFKFKLPKHPRPAWDFQYVIHRVESEKNYGFRGRLIWKKFVSPEDCLREYEQWAATSEVKR